MMTRRELLLAAAAPLVLRGAASLTPRERIDRVLKGETPDRTPFTFWYHFLDEKRSGEDHAKTTLAFHEKYQTDLVKVMSDYPFPSPVGEWSDVQVLSNPFPKQIRAIHAIRQGLNRKAYFVETLFNPINVAEKLSSKEAVARLKEERPQRLMDVLEIIAKSEANHARKAAAAGAAGIFLSIANSGDPDYAKFSEPFDRLVMESVHSELLNILHIHGDHIDLSRFYNGWPVAAINYSTYGTKIPIAEVRQKFSGVILGGLDETNYRRLSAADVERQATEARKAAGTKFILSGGCSLPNDTTEAELRHIVDLKF